MGSNMDKIYIVMDYVEHDLKVLMEHMTEGFTIGEYLKLCFLGWNGFVCPSMCGP